MGKYCTNCGKELHAGARFCAKCGAAVYDAPAETISDIQPVPQPQPNPIPVEQPQRYTPPVAAQKRKSAAVPKSNGGQSALCIVLSVLLIIQITAVAFYGCPGLILGGDSTNVITEKAIVSTENASITLADVHIDVNPLNLIDGEQELSVSRKQQAVDEATGLTEVEYDISLGDMHYLNAPLTLTVPYGKTATAGGDVVLLHYNSDYELWIPQNTTDNGNGTVTASLVSLSPVKLVNLGSKYPRGVFYIDDKGTSNANMVVSHLYWDIIKKQPREEARVIVNDFVENGNTKKSMSWAENLLTPEGINTTNNYYSIFDAFIDTASEFAKLTSMQMKFTTEKISDSIAVIGLGIALTQLAIDLNSSDDNDRTAAMNLYKNLYTSSGTLFTFMTGYSSLSFSAAFFGVAILALGLEYGIEAAEEYKEATNRAIFDQYYKNNAKFDHNYWYTLFVEAYWNQWQNGKASTEGIEAAYDTVQDAMDEYSEKIWADIFREGSDALTFAVGEADKRNYYTPTEEQKTEYIEAHKRYMYGRFNEKVVPWIERFLLEQQQVALYASLYRLCEPFNEYYSIQIQEIAPIDSGDPCKYQEHTIRLGNESGFTLIDIPDTWTLYAPQDDDQWAVRCEFTSLAYILAGAPDRIMLFPKGSDAIYPEDAVLTQTFTITEKETLIQLGRMGITPKWFEGSWKNEEYDVIIRIDIPNNKALVYTVLDQSTQTAITFDPQTASITTEYVPSALLAATYYGYVENGKDYIHVGPYNGERIPGKEFMYSDNEAVWVRIN